MQKIIKLPLLLNENFKVSYNARVALSDTLHIMQKSAPIFKWFLLFIFFFNFSIYEI
jgi:hypothetical protein